jgi:hypothetical protein
MGSNSGCGNHHVGANEYSLKKNGQADNKYHDFWGNSKFELTLTEIEQIYSSSKKKN